MTQYYNRILNVSNIPSPKELDKYYKLNPKPEFKSNPKIPNFKLTREDVKRSTIIVPDLSKMRAGDLLVNTVDDKTEIAIVVDTGYTKGDTSTTKMIDI